MRRREHTADRTQRPGADLAYIAAMVVRFGMCRSKRAVCYTCFFFSSRRRHTRFDCDWSSDVCSSDLAGDLRQRRRHLQAATPPAGPGHRLQAQEHNSLSRAGAPLQEAQGRHHLRGEVADRKSTRLNSSHSQISYAVFCLKKKKKYELNSVFFEFIYRLNSALCQFRSSHDVL